MSEHPAITNEAGRLPTPVNPPGIRLGAAPTIRTAVRAVIVRDGQLLVTVNRSPEPDGSLGEWLITPGGGQDWGESASEALAREVREEIGCEVMVGDLLCVRDYIAARTPSGLEDWFHQQDLFFACELAPGSEPVHVGQDELWQTGLVWVPVAELADLRFYPRRLAEWLTSDPASRPRYLGAVN